jgi:hypothetical protein
VYIDKYNDLLYLPAEKHTPPTKIFRSHIEKLEHITRINVYENDKSTANGDEDCFYADDKITLYVYNDKTKSCEKCGQFEDNDVVIKEIEIDLTKMCLCPDCTVGEVFRVEEPKVEKKEVEKSKICKVCGHFTVTENHDIYNTGCNIWVCEQCTMHNPEVCTKCGQDEYTVKTYPVEELHNTKLVLCSRCLRNYRVAKDTTSNSHYKQSKIQAFEVMQQLDDERAGVGVVCAAKYIMRSHLKGQRESDLRKAIDYLHKELTGEWM